MTNFDLLLIFDVVRAPLAYQNQLKIGNYDKHFMTCWLLQIKHQTSCTCWSRSRSNKNISTFCFRLSRASLVLPFMVCYYYDDYWSVFGVCVCLLCFIYGFDWMALWNRRHPKACFVWSPTNDAKEENTFEISVNYVVDEWFHERDTHHIIVQIAHFLLCTLFTIHLDEGSGWFIPFETLVFFF